MTYRFRHFASWPLWELADEEGHLGRRSSFEVWEPPASVELEGNRLIYSIAEDDEDPEEVPTDSQLLPGFINLVDADASVIRNFALRYGALGLCTHGLSVRHRAGDRAPASWLAGAADDLATVRVRPKPEQRFDWCDYLPVSNDVSDIRVWEPVNLWREYSRLARSILNLGAQIEAGERGDTEDWRTALVFYCRLRDFDRRWSWLEGLDHYDAEDSQWRRRMLLCRCVNDWLNMANVAPQLSPHLDSGQPQVMLDGGGDGALGTLIGALGVQIMLAIGRTDSLAQCTGCGRPYLPLTREGTPYRPSNRRRNYCETCREAGVPQRDAARDYRARKKEKQGSTSPNRLP